MIHYNYGSHTGNKLVITIMEGSGNEQAFIHDNSAVLFLYTYIAHTKAPTTEC